MRIRVYNLAFEFGKSHDSMVALCRHLGFEIKGALTSLTAEEAQKVRDFVTSDPREPQKEVHPQLMRDLGITR